MVGTYGSGSPVTCSLALTHTCQGHSLSYICTGGSEVEEEVNRTVAHKSAFLEIVMAEYPHIQSPLGMGG